MLQQYDERVQIRRVPVQIPGKLMPLLDLGRWRFKVTYGGRGGAKSHSIAQALISADQNVAHCVLPGVQDAGRVGQAGDQDYIDRMGVGDSFSCLKNMIIHQRTGSSFGTRAARTREVDQAWRTCTSPGGGRSVGRSWEMLIPTIRPASPGQVGKVWASTIRLGRRRLRPVRGARDPDAWVAQVGWRDNPFFPAVLEAERVRCAR
jgi:hypothetical protein